MVVKVRVLKNLEEGRPQNEDQKVKKVEALKGWNSNGWRMQLKLKGFKKKGLQLEV